MSAIQSIEDEEEDPCIYGYAILWKSRTSQISGLIDVSSLIGTTHEGYVAKTKLLGSDHPAVMKIESLLAQLASMRLRARFDMSEGPYLIRSPVALDMEKLENVLLSFNDEYRNNFLRGAKI